jgi:hypothetical protein
VSRKAGRPEAAIGGGQPASVSPTVEQQTRWRAAQKSLALGDTDSQPQRFVESEWSHAGA